MINSNFRCIVQVYKIRPEIHHANVFDKIWNRNNVSTIEQTMKLIICFIYLCIQMWDVWHNKNELSLSSFRQYYIPSNKNVK